jgi:hypothetical protein
MVESVLDVVAEKNWNMTTLSQFQKVEAIQPEILSCFVKAVIEAKATMWYEIVIG